MCGIIGIVSNYQDVSERVLHSIARLEYRGYDSAGIATIFSNGFNLLKLAGKVKDLKAVFKKNPTRGRIGIGHTRWATHGAPSYENAHPMLTKDIALVHNGIIENYMEIKEELKEQNYEFSGDTDTEVLANLIQSYIDQKQPLDQAIRNAADRCHGLYAFIVISSHDPNTIIGVKKGLPLAVGIGENEMYFGSDAYALFPLTNKLIYLNDNEIATITSREYKVCDMKGNELNKEIKKVSIQEVSGKEEFEHYMLKEIYEQPSAIARCFDHYYDSNKKELLFKAMDFNWNEVKKVYIIACGTSYYAGAVAKYWLEQKTKINVEIDIASEFRYREPVLDTKDVFIFISQSGETADTLAALKMVKEKGIKTFAVVNVEESSMGNLADFVLPICAGSEIGVASTKAFTCQLIVLSLLSLYISYAKGLLSNIEFEKELLKLHETPGKVTETLNLDRNVKTLAENILHLNNIIYIGRGIAYPIALEGALKIKELSYLPALGMPAGELKHGPIALIDNNTPVCVIAPNDKLFAKTASNLQEAYARGGKIILFSDKNGIEQLKNFCFMTIELPEADDFTAPLLYTIPLQMLAYHFAVLKGNDVDQPRNLAKSVTVE
ncbi:glucosamine--fructose-6-phosphate aminotransferase [endosymbiont of Acanthamoeba sp. UWC8]|uniref:glutamine--fructose-6-phosphate transaminase (isomerizing) n=1 Tax=endosymbiont of Acanthamoeba sp. UWC8 TaxID=86106 RepID=UPI0004D1EB54|nr:glutamine--fructose-6-phosphate transaminase (isomerizing) [endosymbiont of Acanthamoeba sp. UWC8]AIF81385.1 glucosamine--fructose-6-phosphate aminotransferase [endosymbiont of Acanthamoeba sp. UWC8]